MFLANLKGNKWFIDQKLDRYFLYNKPDFAIINL